MSTDEIKSLLSCDLVTKHRGSYIAYKGFFYTNGYTAEKFADRVKSKFPNAIIEEAREVWKPFVGGASLKKQSHWRVRFKLNVT